MFLIVLLGALWLLLSETGRSYIANFAAVISGNTVIATGNTNAGRVAKTGSIRTKSTSTPHKSLIPAHTPYKGLLPTHKFLGGLYPAP